ncbi:MAG: 7-cyano-7-deazaguanine synthase QueC [Phycisphaeraceae bacterium]|nr:MAG: 7-cyano-7-deazaguanine synthase QueC [Phycisphaeraceae bacterium]
MTSDAPARPRAVVLHSGGIDSTTVLAVAIRDGFEACAISFDYNQRHRAELDAAARTAAALGVARRLIFPIDLRTIGGSALTDEIEVPKARPADAISADIPVTYVPARNLIFLSIALAWAETLGARDLYAGVNAIDYSGYPDCRPEFIEAFNETANLATRIGVEGADIHVHTPLAELGKADIIRRAIDLGVDLSLTHSCYDPSPEGLACGLCDSCVLRRRGFEAAGVADPTRYAVG